MPPMPSPNTGRLKKVENLPSNQNCTVIPDTLPATVYFGAVEVRNWMIVGAEQEQTYPLPALKLTNGVKSVLHRDALGSVRAITDAAGVKVESAVYKPFGEQTEWLSAAQTAPESKGWIGERHNADAGLQYLNARYYDPALGLFLKPDWFEVTMAGVGTNRFSYSFNDPVNMSDPGGDNCYSNSSSGHCKRSEEYSKLADDKELTKKTSFMHAAENVTWSLGDIDRSKTLQWWVGGNGIVADEDEREFLEKVGQKLFKENMKVVDDIKERLKNLFLSEMEAVVPWRRLMSLIEPHYPKSGPKGGRPPMPLEI